MQALLAMATARPASAWRSARSSKGWFTWSFVPSAIRRFSSQRPSAQMAASRCSPSQAVVLMPSTHWGMAVSACMGHCRSQLCLSLQGSAWRIRFHQPLLSSATTRLRSGSQRGWNTEISCSASGLLPARVRTCFSCPSGVMEAQQSSLASQGMAGWRHSTQASWLPSALSAGYPAKSSAA